MGRKMERAMGIRRLAAIALICNSSTPLRGMARSIRIDRTQDSLYSSIVGKEYRTKVDLLLFQYDDSKEILIGKYGNNLPDKSEMKEKFPFRYYATKILAVLPPGSVFKVIRVMEEGDRSLVFTNYYAVLVSTSNEKFVGKEIGPTFLTLNSSERLRKFDPEYVEEVKQETP